MKPSLRAKVDRISACALEAVHDEFARNLLHAYVGSLTPEEVCETAVHALIAPAEFLGAILTRLLRMGREGVALAQIDTLGRRLVGMTHTKGKARVRIEAFLSHIYPFLAPPTRQALLDCWRDRGTRGAAARWLKAIADDELLFSIDIVLDYWRRSHDWRAAKVLVQRASSGLITEILPELIGGCEEGWIVSRSALRAHSIAQESWTAVRSKFPATYAYLCAKTGRSLSEQEALAIIEDCDGGALGDRGLAIWAVGQLGMVSVLDRLWTMRSEFRARDLRRLGIVEPDETGSVSRSQAMSSPARRAHGDSQYR